MIELPTTSYPLLPLMKTLTSLPFFLDLAQAIDGFVSHICQRVAQQPRQVPNVQADGTMQTITLTPALTREPAFVLAIVSQAPTHTIGTDVTAAPYSVEYGAHTKEVVRVKITVPAGASQPKFDLFVIP